MVCALAALTLSTGGRASAAVDYPAQPGCVRVPVGDDTFRLYLHPGEVVSGEVVSVRSGHTHGTARRDGVWVSEQQRVVPENLWHVVIKSDAALFSERRHSLWVHCSKVMVKPIRVG